MLDATAEAELTTQRLSGLGPNTPWFQGKEGTSVPPQTFLVHASNLCLQRSFPPQAFLNVFLGRSSEQVQIILKIKFFPVRVLEWEMNISKLMEEECHSRAYRES